MRISVNAVLSFFDTRQDLKHFASGVKAVLGDEFGLQLLCHYFRHQGKQAKIVSRSASAGGELALGWTGGFR